MDAYKKNNPNIDNQYKPVVDTKVDTKTAFSREADGTIVETITTTTTNIYSDGSQDVKTEVKTIKKKDPGIHPPGGTGTHQQVLNTNLTPANSTAPKIKNTTESSFIEDCFRTHNELRSKHGAPALTLDADLGKIAQAWAKEIAKQGQMKHSTSGFGENVYWNTEKPFGGRPARAWYSEIKDYDFDKLEGQKGTGHFTQLIWKSTTSMGVAMEKGKNNDYFVVANYFPPGNVKGKYPANIQREIKK